MQRSLTRYGTSATKVAIQHELELQLAEIQAASTVARYGIRELDHTHRGASALYKKTLETALQAIQNAAHSGRLTQIQLAALYHFAEAYRYELLSIVEETGDSLINELECW